MTKRKAIIIIALLGFTVYFNSLHNGFVLDDFPQIVNNIFVHSISNFFNFFQGSTYYPNLNEGKLVGSYYRPMMVVSFSLIHTFFGNNPFYYHFFQVCLHVVNTVLIYLLFIKFFSKTNSLIVSLLFLIHPINVESVASIPAFQEVLFMFFGMLALHFLINFKKKVRLRDYVVIFMLLLFSALSKETGILFLGILPIFSFLFKKKNKFPIMLVSVSSFLTYLFLRVIVAQFPFIPSSIFPLSDVGFFEKLITFPKIIFSYFQTFTLPIHLVTLQIWSVRKINFQDFFLPLIIDAVIFIGVIGLGYSFYRRKSRWFNIYGFFVVWLVVGLLWHLNLNRMDAVVADRWFYFPEIGIFGIATIVLEIIRVPKKVKYFGYVFLTLLVLGFSMRTVIRNSNWKSTYSIVTHDIKYHQDNWYLHYLLASEFMKQKKYSKAIMHYDKAYKLSGKIEILSDLGIAYGQNGNLRKSEATYEKLLKNDPKYWLGYLNYGYMVLPSRPQKAKELAETALKYYPTNPRLLVLLALSNYKLGNYDESIALIEEAYRIFPDEKKLKIMRILKERKPIESAFK